MAKHSSDCPYQWGACPRRSRGSTDRPHVCGLERGHSSTHLCDECLLQQA